MEKSREILSRERAIVRNSVNRTRAIQPNKTRLAAFRVTLEGKSSTIKTHLALVQQRNPPSARRPTFFGLVFGLATLYLDYVSDSSRFRPVRVILEHSGDSLLGSERIAERA